MVEGLYVRYRLGGSSEGKSQPYWLGCASRAGARLACQCVNSDDTLVPVLPSYIFRPPAILAGGSELI